MRFSFNFGHFGFGNYLATFYWEQKGRNFLGVISDPMSAATYGNGEAWLQRFSHFNFGFRNYLATFYWEQKGRKGILVLKLFGYFLFWTKRKKRKKEEICFLSFLLSSFSFFLVKIKSGQIITETKMSKIETRESQDESCDLRKW